MAEITPEQEQANFFDEFYAAQHSDNKALLDDWLEILKLHCGKHNMGDQSAKVLLAVIIPLVAFAPVKAVPIAEPLINFVPMIDDGSGMFCPRYCRCGGEMYFAHPGSPRCSNGCDE
jgi:hypothetical protein